MYIKRNQATTVAEVVELNTGIKAEEFIKTCKLPFVKNIKEAKEKELRKQQWRHDFRVALFSAVVGGFTGFLATVITQMLL